MAAVISNKKMLRRTALRSVLSNKGKYTALLVAVILTSTLFCSVLSMGISLYSSFRRSVNREFGAVVNDAAVLCSCRGTDEINEFVRVFSKEKGISDINWEIYLGYTPTDNSRVMMLYMPEEYTSRWYSEVQHGHYPAAENEIAMSDVRLSELGIKPEPGQKIHLEYNLITPDDTQPAEGDFILSGWWEENIDSGMLTDILVSAEFYNGISDNVPENLQIFFNLKKNINAGKKLADLVEKYPEIIQSRDMSELKSDVAHDVMLDGVLFLLCLIMFITGYLIIKNIFSMNVLFDTRYYGLLRTLGTTSRQIAGIVRFQAFAVGAVACPLGILTGTAVSAWILNLLANSLNINPKDMYLDANVWIYILTVVFTYLTIYAGCRKPARIAAGTSPLEAMRLYPHGTVKKQFGKMRKKITLLSLAWNNAVADRKRIILVSLAFALPLFFINSAYIFFSDMSEQMVKHSETVLSDDTIAVCHKAWRRYEYNFNSSSYIPEESADEFAAHEYVERRSDIFYSQTVSTDMTPEMLEDYNSINAETDPEYKAADRDVMLCDLYGISGTVTENISVYEGSFDEEKWNTGEYAVVDFRKYSEHTDEYSMRYYDIGSEVEFTLPGGETKCYKIMAYGEVPAEFMSGRWYALSESVYVPSSSLPESFRSRNLICSYFDIKHGRTGDAEHDFEIITRKNETLMWYDNNSISPEDRETAAFKKIAFIVILLFASVSSLNLVNTISVSVKSRISEFGIMNTLGLTSKQMNTMMFYEGFSYAAVTCVIASLISLAFTGTVLTVMYRLMGYNIVYEFRAEPILVSVPFITVLSVITAAVNYRYINSHSVVEQIKEL